jgi:hypothetical protein
VLVVVMVAGVEIQARRIAVCRARVVELWLRVALVLDALLWDQTEVEEEAEMGARMQGQVADLTTSWGSPETWTETPTETKGYEWPWAQKLVRPTPIWKGENYRVDARAHAGVCDGFGVCSAYTARILHSNLD